MSRFTVDLPILFHNPLLTNLSHPHGTSYKNLALYIFFWFCEINNASPFTVHTVCLYICGSSYLVSFYPGRDLKLIALGTCRDSEFSFPLENSWAKKVFNSSGNVGGRTC